MTDPLACSCGNRWTPAASGGEDVTRELSCPLCGCRVELLEDHGDVR
ncbi:MAG: hypothetical protein NTY19_51890 [Planctomycetota bacterium]|nr:hypothetical protein [Planctomycetota bacterium]